MNLVEFIGNSPINLEQLCNQINQEIALNSQTRVFDILPNQFEERFYKLPYQIPENKAFRAMQIGNYAPIPCGGTHISQISEIGAVTICKISTKGDRTKVAYEVVKPCKSNKVIHLGYPFLI